MSNYLWKVIAVRDNGSLKKGMTVEILKANGTKPNQDDIAQALNTKYNSDIHKSKCGSSIFTITKS